MAGKPLRSSILLVFFGSLWILSGLLGGSSSSNGPLVGSSFLLYVRADGAVAAEEEEAEAELERETGQGEPQVCVPSPPADCSEHEQTIRQLTDSVGALRTELEEQEAASKNAQAERRRSQEACQLQVEEIRAEHLAKLQEKEAELLEATAALSNYTNDAQKDELISQLQASFEALQQRHDGSVRDREELAAQLETTAAQLQDLLKDHRALEERAAHARGAESKRRVELENELRDARARLDASRRDLFEARRELHAVWEKYAGIRDAWWNVPSRYDAVAHWCALQLQKLHTQLDRLSAAVRPHLNRAGYFVGTALLTMHQQISSFVDFLHHLTVEWFLPNWRMYVQPHLNQVGHFLVEQGRKLSVVATDQGRVAAAWAGRQWSTMAKATAPQRERIADLVRPTRDMLQAQVAPATAAIRSAWAFARTAAHESTLLESAAQSLHSIEVRVASLVAAALGVAHDYLALQNAPPALVRHLQEIRDQATSHAATAAAASSGTPSSVALAAATAIAAMLLTAMLWRALSRPHKKKARQQGVPPPPPPPPSSPPKSQTPQQNQRPSPRRSAEPKPLRPQPSPSLVTEPSSTSVRTTPASTQS